jgi:hypothetical protein
MSQTYQGLMTYEDVTPILLPCLGYGLCCNFAQNMYKLNYAI